MRAKSRMPYRGYFLVVAFSLAAAGMHARQSSAQNKEQKDDAAGFQEFSDRVQDYVKLQKTVESKLPALKSTDLPEMITAHQQALARMIREARPNAKAGDIFTRSAREAFRHVIRRAFEGPHADDVRAAMKLGVPLKDIHLRVNGIYPDAVPYATVPITLLANFPTLPDVLAYRIVGPDLVLIDVKSNMVVDLARALIPSKP
jgi:hypothetical protein